MFKMTSVATSTLKRAALIGSAAVLAVTFANVPTPTRAASAVVGGFRATCDSFSVNVAVTGVDNEVNGQDRIRYQVIDSANKKLYLEDATRPVGVTAGNNVVGINYNDDGVQDGLPTVNPIRFQVLDLDVNGAVKGIVFEGTYNAECLPAGATAPLFSGEYIPPDNGRAVINVTTPILLAPGGQQIQNLVVEGGKNFIVSYKSPDGAYVAIFIGSSDLVWVATSAVTVNLATLPVKPNRVENFFQAPAGATAIVVGTTVPGTPAPLVLPPGTVGGITTVYNLRLRALPNTTSAIITRLPFRSEVIVFGKDASGRFYKVSYNNAIGWVSSTYIRLNGATKANLPVTN